MEGVIKTKEGTTLKSCPAAEHPLGSPRSFGDYIPVQPLPLFILRHPLLHRCGAWHHPSGPPASKSQSLGVFLGVITMFPTTFLSCLMYPSHPCARWAKMNWSPQGPQQPRWERSPCWEKPCFLSPQILKLTAFLLGSKSPPATPRAEKTFSIGPAPGVLRSCSSLFMRMLNSWQQLEWRDWVLQNLTKTNRIFKSWLVSWCF